MTPFIAQNDLNYRIEQAKEFLKDGHQVKVVVRFTGRQISRKQYGFDLLARFKSQIDEIARVDKEPRLVGKMLFQTFIPKSKK